MVRFKLLCLFLEPFEDGFRIHSEHWVNDVADPSVTVIAIHRLLDDWRASDFLGSDVNHSDDVTWETVDVIRATSYPSNRPLILFCASVGRNVLQRLPLFQGNRLINSQSALIKQFGIWRDGLFGGWDIALEELSEIIEAVDERLCALDDFELHGRLDGEVVDLSDNIETKIIRISVVGKLGQVEELEFVYLQDHVGVEKSIHGEDRVQLQRHLGVPLVSKLIETELVGPIKLLSGLVPLETDGCTTFVFEAQLIVLVGIIGIYFRLLKLEKALLNLLWCASYHQTWFFMGPGV